MEQVSDQRGLTNGTIGGIMYYEIQKKVYTILNINFMVQKRFFSGCFLSIFQMNN